MVVKFQSLFRTCDYKRYKKTPTRYVQQQLGDLVPFPIESVSNLKEAADYVHGALVKNGKNTRDCELVSLDKQQTHENLIYKLEESIALRQLVGATYTKDPDGSHKHVDPCVEILPRKTAGDSTSRLGR